jgi:hypothetical protein
MLHDSWRVQKKDFSETKRVLEESLHDSEAAAIAAFERLTVTEVQRVEMQKRGAGQSRYRSVREKGYCAMVSGTATGEGSRR